MAMASHPMQPRVTKRERKLHLSYELPHRIYCSDVYPIAAPNGSTVILYGHERGLRVLWRGGRRRRRDQEHAPPTRTNGNTHDTIDLISDDEAAPEEQNQQTEDQYEAEEEEQDPDCPYPNIIEDLDIALRDDNNPIAALHLAVPALNPLVVRSSVLRKNAIVTVVCSNAKVLLLRIPLALPSDGTKEELLAEVLDSVIELNSVGPIPSGLAIKYLPADHQPTLPREEADDAEGHLVIVAVSRSLHVWSVVVASDFLIGTKNNSIRKVPITATATKTAFHPSARHAQLLVVDSAGLVRIYDPYAVNAPTVRPGSHDSAFVDANLQQGSGKWVMAYHTPNQDQKDTPDAASVLTQRKKVLDAKWVLAGKAIIVLLQDGEWGVWDLHAMSGKQVEDFAIRGFLGTSSHTETTDPLKQRGSSKLAPMTPNTRKSKAEQLFTGVPKVPGVAPRGAISVSSISARGGQSDESVIIWYGSDVYSITSMQSFWQRSTTRDGGVGSLYSPGLSHITDAKLYNESITSIAHLPTTKTAIAALGQMNTQRDIIVSAEHRAIVLQSLQPTMLPRQLFQQHWNDRPAVQDQQMLDSGTLDIDGMDRMLDNMAEHTTTRRVLFAAE